VDVLCPGVLFRTRFVALRCWRMCALPPTGRFPEDPSFLEALKFLFSSNFLVRPTTREDSPSNPPSFSSLIVFLSEEVHLEFCALGFPLFYYFCPTCFPQGVGASAFACPDFLPFQGAVAYFLLNSCLSSSAGGFIFPFSPRSLFEENLPLLTPLLLVYLEAAVHGKSAGSLLPRSLLQARAFFPHSFM